MSELNEKIYADLAVDIPASTGDCLNTEAEIELEAPPRTGEFPHLDSEQLELDDLEVVATLGVGGFGRVELVKVKYCFAPGPALRVLIRIRPGDDLDLTIVRPNLLIINDSVP